MVSAGDDPARLSLSPDDLAPGPSGDLYAGLDLSALNRGSYTCPQVLTLALFSNGPFLLRGGPNRLHRPRAFVQPSGGLTR